MLGPDDARQVKAKGLRVGLSGIDVEYSMARNGYRAILVIGRLLKTKISVRMWGEDDDDDATRAHGRTEIGRLQTYNQGYREIRARNQPLWVDVDERSFCAYAESKQIQN
jgi:hypothetical protein